MRPPVPVALLAMVGLALAAPASAHEVSTEFRPVLDEVVPAVPGLEVDVAPGLASTLTVRNETGARFEAIGSDGRPFLRVRRGGVSANVGSPDWYLSESVSAAVPLPAVAEPGAEPRWMRIADGNEWSWIEHRLELVDIGDPEATWIIPARIGKQELEIRGRWRGEEVRGEFRTVLEGIRPGVSGLDVRVLPGGTPAFFVRNDSGQLLEVPGPGGKRFLRIGPEGSELAISGGRWAKLGAQPVWAWVEPRAGWPEREPPADALAADDPTRLREWTVTARIDGEPVEVSGYVEWVPLRAHHQGGRREGSPLFGWVVAGVVGLSLLVLGGLALRRRGGIGRIPFVRDG